MSTMIVPFSFAADSLEIIPSAKNPNELWKEVDCVAGGTFVDANKVTQNCPGVTAKSTVRDRYNAQWAKYCWGKTFDLGAAFSTWIMSWDCIIEYIVYIIRFLSQIWLLVWVLMIIYAGYKYATAVFSSGKTPSPDIIKNAIIWVLIVIFAYAIIKALTAAFL